jgi:hypothetical protein
VIQVNLYFIQYSKLIEATRQPLYSFHVISLLTKNDVLYYCLIDFRLTEKKTPHKILSKPIEVGPVSHGRHK